MKISTEKLVGFRKTSKALRVKKTLLTIKYLESSSRIQVLSVNTTRTDWFVLLTFMPSIRAFSTASPKLILSPVQLMTRTRTPAESKRDSFGRGGRRWGGGKIEEPGYLKSQHLGLLHCHAKVKSVPGIVEYNDKGASCNNKIKQCQGCQLQ